MALFALWLLLLVTAAASDIAIVPANHPVIPIFTYTPPTTANLVNATSSYGHVTKRDVSASASPTLSVITTTLSDKIVLGTYQLETLTQYSALRQSITVTQNATATKSDGSFNTGVAVAVIGAGGVGWVLVGKVKAV
jgi:hypothetical protein